MTIVIFVYVPRKKITSFNDFLSKLINYFLNFNIYVNLLFGEKYQR